MKNYIKALLVGFLAIGFGIQNVDAASTPTKKIEASACETIYTNYYFFLDANTTDVLGAQPLDLFTHSTVAEYHNNSYQIKNFDAKNVGYGQVEVSRTTKTSKDGISSISLEDFYDVVLYASKVSGGAYSSGTRNFIVAHDWYSVDSKNVADKQNGKVDFTSYSKKELANASLDAKSVITRQSSISASAENPFSIRIDRSYYGYLTGAPLLANGKSWYIQPALYYVQYCSLKQKTVEPDEEYFKIIYDGNGDNVTNIPSTEKDRVGTCIEITKQKPVREGYEFLGWGTKRTSVDDDYTPSVDSYCGQKGDITLYAIWKKKEQPVTKYYTVYYKENTIDTVTGMPSDNTVEADRDVYIASNIPVRHGYSFVGWNTDSKSSEAQYVGNDLYKDRKDIVLYAIWKQNPAPVTPPSNPQTGIEDFMLPLGGITAVAGIALTILKKKAYKL